MSSGVPALSEQTTGVAQDRGNAYCVALTVSATVDTTTAPLGAVNGVVYSMTNAGATTLTFPSNATTAYPIGYKVTIADIGAGTCTITAGGGATLAIGAAAAVATTTSRTVYKTAINTWTITS